MTEWKSPKTELPPQGKKILYFDHGDIYVVQRFGRYWFPIPFADSKFRFHTAPEYWADIKPPLPFKGLMEIDCDGKMMTIDEFQSSYPQDYEQFVECLAKSFGALDDN